MSARRSEQRAAAVQRRILDENNNEPEPNPLQEPPELPDRPSRAQPTFDMSDLKDAASTWTGLLLHGGFNVNCFDSVICLRATQQLEQIARSPGNTSALLELQELLAQYHGRMGGTSRASPALRRLTMATLMAARAELGDGWMQEQEEAYTRVSLMWLHIHQAAARKKGIVELTHVSKCGGTSMCQLAMRNGCTNPDPSEQGNCNIARLNDQPLWTVPATFMVHGHHALLRPYCVYDCKTYLKLPEKTCSLRNR